MDKLEELRKRIDIVDSQLVTLLEERFELVAEVAAYKLDNNLPVLHANREKEVIEKNTACVAKEDFKEYIGDTLKAMMEVSRKYQSKILEEYNSK